jgi:hypothetical protein
MIIDEAALIPFMDEPRHKVIRAISAGIKGDASFCLISAPDGPNFFKQFNDSNKQDEVMP